MITALVWSAPFLIPLLAVFGLRWVDRQLPGEGEDWGAHRKYAEEYFQPKEDNSESA